MGEVSPRSENAAARTEGCGMNKNALWYTQLIGETVHRIRVSACAKCGNLPEIASQSGTVIIACTCGESSTSKADFMAVTNWNKKQQRKNAGSLAEG